MQQGAKVKVAGGGRRGEQDKGPACATQWGGRAQHCKDPNSCEAAWLASFDQSALYKKVLLLLQKWP